MNALHLQLIVPEGFHTNKLCSRLSSSEVRFYTEHGRFFAVLSTLWGGGSCATYVHRRLIGKRVVDTELFSLGVTTEALGANIG